MDLSKCSEAEFCWVARNRVVQLERPIRRELVALQVETLPTVVTMAGLAEVGNVDEEAAVKVVSISSNLVQSLRWAHSLTLPPRPSLPE